MSDLSVHEHDERYMRLAIDLAELSLAEDVLPVGAVVLVNGKLRAIGRKSRDGNKRLDHAEIVAMREAMRFGIAKEQRVTVYSTLEPCTMCYAALLNCGVSRVVYALEDPYDGGTGISASALPVRHRERMPEVTAGVLREESRALFMKYLDSTGSAFWCSHPDNPLARTIRGMSKSTPDILRATLRGFKNKKRIKPSRCAACKYPLYVREYVYGRCKPNMPGLTGLYYVLVTYSWCDECEAVRWVSRYQVVDGDHPQLLQQVREATQHMSQMQDFRYPTHPRY